MRARRLTHWYGEPVEASGALRANDLRRSRDFLGLPVADRSLAALLGRKRKTAHMKPITTALALTATLLTTSAFAQSVYFEDFSESRLRGWQIIGSV